MIGGFLLAYLFLHHKYNVSDNKLEEVLSDLVVDIMLEAHDNDIELTLSDICKMVGIPYEGVTDGEDAYFTVNDELVEAMRNKELRKAMIESLFATKH